MKEIIFQCDTCQHQNRQWMGTPNFEFKIYEFRSFSEAWNHMFENRDHHVDIIERDDEE